MATIKIQGLEFSCQGGFSINGKVYESIEYTAAVDEGEAKGCSPYRGKPLRDRLTIADKRRAYELARGIYERHAAGCCWHIVLDDGNYTQSNVDFCRDRAAENQHPDCIELGGLVDRMSLTQRNKLSRGGYRKMVEAMYEQESRELLKDIPVIEASSIDFRGLGFAPEQVENHTADALRFALGGAGSYQGSGTLTLNGEAFKELFNTGALEPTYMERDGRLLSFCGHVEGGTADDLRFNGELWSPIGTTRPGARTDRLRKFVWRGGQLVEVRARGRTGQRGLRAAVIAAGLCPPSQEAKRAALSVFAKNVHIGIVFREDGGAGSLEQRILRKLATPPSYAITYDDGSAFGSLRSGSSGHVMTASGEASPLMTMCDLCDIEFPAGQLGSSFIRIPDSDISSEDMRDRCADCTREHGPAASPPAGGTVGMPRPSEPAPAPAGNDDDLPW